MDDNGYSLITKLLTGVVTGLSAGLGWLLSRWVGMNDRLTAIEISNEVRTPIYAEMQRVQEEHRERLVAVETIVEKINEVQVANLRSYTELVAKLEILTRIDESLNNLARVCEKIVPREEWDLNNRHMDERLRKQEARRG
jgi:uncharacterized protein with von Willebrand factor type A (vWA) domain